MTAHQTAELRHRRQECEHDIRAALFGMAATADGLCRRHQLTPRQFDQLAAGLAAEARRVRLMLDDEQLPLVRFGLLAAIGPALASGRASGLTIELAAEPEIEVLGRPDRTAQVVLGLLDNARQHAPGSPVDIRASVCGQLATLVVEDRGPGISGAAPERLFGREVCGAASGGSGLGLFIARRLMAEQDGSISACARPGGGASFVLHFRLP